MTAAKSKKADTSYVGTYEEALERGYFGRVPDPHPNSDYSLASGPDGVPLAEVTAEIADVRHTELVESVTESKES